MSKEIRNGYSQNNTYMLKCSLCTNQKGLTELITVQWPSRVTSLEQLSLAEFSGEKTRPMDYENGHKNTFGCLVVLDLIEDQKLNPILVTKYI